METYESALKKLKDKAENYKRKAEAAQADFALKKRKRLNSIKYALAGHIISLARQNKLKIYGPTTINGKPIDAAELYAEFNELSGWKPEATSQPQAPVL